MDVWVTHKPFFSVSPQKNGWRLKCHVFLWGRSYRHYETVHKWSSRWGGSVQFFCGIGKLSRYIDMNLKTLVCSISISSSLKKLGWKVHWCWFLHDVHCEFHHVSRLGFLHDPSNLDFGNEKSYYWSCEYPCNKKLEVIIHVVEAEAVYFTYLESPTCSCVLFNQW